MIEAMISAGTPERLIHIFDKTGFIVNKSGWDKLSEAERSAIKKV